MQRNIGIIDLDGTANDVDAGSAPPDAHVPAASGAIGVGGCSSGDLRIDVLTMFAGRQGFHVTTGPHATLTELPAAVFARLQGVPHEAAVEIRRFTARVPLPLGELETKGSVSELLWCSADRGVAAAKAHCTRRTWSWSVFPDIRSCLRSQRRITVEVWP